MTQTESILQKLKDFYASPEGQEHLTQERAKIKKEHEFKSRWTDKITSYLEAVKDLDTVYSSWATHNKKQTDIKWKRHIDGEADINYYILEAFERIGIPYQVEDGMFTAAAYEYKGYIAELICGQGSFITFYKEEN
jgi:hypothetical protein